MKITAEQIAKMKAAKTAEELIALAKAEGIEATEEQIKAQFDAMHKEGEIADEELDNVSGAGCDGLKPYVECEPNSPDLYKRVTVTNLGKDGQVIEVYYNDNGLEDWHTYKVRFDDGSEAVVDEDYILFI